MALAIDTKVVLRAMAEHPTAFPVSQADLVEMARKSLIKELKSKTLNLIGLKQICQFVLAENVRILIDGFTTAELAGLVKKIDPHSPFAKSAEDTSGARDHILAMASGAHGVTPEPVKETKSRPRAAKPTKTVAPAKTGDLLESQVHSGKAKTTRAKKAV